MSQLHSVTVYRTTAHHSAAAGLHTTHLSYAENRYISNHNCIVMRWKQAVSKVSDGQPPGRLRPQLKGFTESELKEALYT